MVKNFLNACLFCLGFILLETSILSNIHSLRYIPDLILICSIYLAVNNGKLFGTTIGFVSGMFLDFMTIGPFGLNCLVHTVMGYFFGTFRKTLNTSGVLIPLVFGFAFTLIKGICLFIVSILYPNLKYFDLISLDFLMQILITAILTPFIFKFLNKFNRILLIDIAKVVS